MFQLMFCQVKKGEVFRKDRPIPSFNTSLKHATYQLSETNTTCNNMVTQNGIDFMWLLQTFTNTTPLYYGYLSRYVIDHPPCTLVTYVDPISLPLTKKCLRNYGTKYSRLKGNETEISYCYIRSSCGT